MEQYYNGITDMRNKYIKTDRANNIVEPNFMKQFINEELSYLLGNKITYVSKNSNSECIEDIKRVLYPWSNNHDKDLMKAALKFGEAYELYYSDNNSKLTSKIYTPLNSYVYYSEYDEVEAFLYFYKKLFDDTLYMDLWESNTVKHYNADTLTFRGEESHIFNRVPVSVVGINENETIYNAIKGLQDAYSQVLSDLVNEIADNRNAYLVVDGDVPTSEELNAIKKNGVIGGGVGVSWLIKNINDTFVQNTLTTLEKDMLKVTSHIDFQEKLQSNSSSLALRTRLISLENKVKAEASALIDALEDRITFIFDYLRIKEGKVYDSYDIEPKITLSLPQDDIMVAQISSQMGDRISTETLLSQLSFVDNPLNEINKIKAEKDSDRIDLDNIPDDEGVINE
jgi:SPP1 family phage portal protein